MGTKQSLKDSSLHKDSKYIQLYIVPYKNLGVTGGMGCRLSQNYKKLLVYKKHCNGFICTAKDL